MRRLVCLLALTAAALLLAACDGGGQQGRVTIGMKDNFFGREVTRIDPGDTVRFANEGQALHDAVAADGAFQVPVTDGADDDDGNGLLEPGEFGEITLTEPGVYTFYCTLHGTADGEGMAAVLVVGDQDYSSAGEQAPDEPVTEWTGVTRRVGDGADEYPTIQNAVDAADPGDLVLVEEGVYTEQVNVTTPYITIRGVDRNTVIIDGEFARPNGISIFAADGVAVENLTVRNATENGVFWTGVTGYRALYVTAYNNGVYGIYAFDSVDGVFEHSLVSGSADAGFYIGQCDPCDAVIRDVVAQDNALGYSGTNASGVYILDSVWRDNVVGIAPNTLDSELLPPVRNVTIAGNLVIDNDNVDAPSLDIEWPAFGNGIMIAGGLGSTVTHNLVVNHARSGIFVTPNLSTNFWMSGDNIVRDNVILGSGYADITLSGPALAGNCFAGNEFSGGTVPPGLETFQSCDGLRAPWRFDVSSTLSTIGLVAEVTLDLKGDVDYRDLPAPGERPGMPGGAEAPVVPAVDVFDAAEVDLAAIETPALPDGLVVDDDTLPVLFGVPLALGVPSLYFAWVGWLLPFGLLAIWIALALIDLARREDLGTPARMAWLGTVLVVPFVGPILYHSASGSPLPRWLRGLVVWGGLVFTIVLVAVGVTVGGVL